MSELLKQTKDFAHRAHDLIKQVRKYTLEPYWVHTDEVADIVAAHGGTENMIAASDLHDYREDVVTALIKQGRFAELAELEAEYNTFPMQVRYYVDDLTDEYTSEKHPGINRATRKALECARIANIQVGSKIIKLADLKSNTASIVPHDPEFAVTYLAEKTRLLDVLVDSNEELYDKVVKQLNEAHRQLGEMALQAELKKA